MLSNHQSLSSTKIQPLPRFPTPPNIKLLAQQLELLWQQVDSLHFQDYFTRTHTLLVEVLVLIDRHNYRKPDWRSIFYKNLSASVRSKCSAIPFYYFRLATTLSTQLSLSCLIRLLSEDCGSPLSNHDSHSLKLLKINYSIRCGDSKKQFQKHFDFLEKISIKLLKFVASLNCSPECQQFFTYYLSIVISCQNEYSFRFRKIVTVAFDSYCKYSAANNLPLKWNIFQIMSRIINLNENVQEEDQDLLFYCCSSFIKLIVSPEVAKYMSQVTSQMSVYGHLSVFIHFLGARAAAPKREGRRNFGELIENLGLRMIISGSSVPYFGFTIYFKSKQDNKSSLSFLLIDLMILHYKVKNFSPHLPFENYSKWLTNAEQTLDTLSRYWSEETYLNIVMAFIIDINKFINGEVDQMIRKFDMTNFMSLTRQEMTSYVAVLPLYQFIVKYASLNFKNQSFKAEYLQGTLLHRIFYCLLIICQLSNSENSQRTLVQFTHSQYSPFIARGQQSAYLLRILYTVNRLAWTKHAKLAEKVVLALVNNARFSDLLNQPKIYTMFSAFERAYRKKTDCCIDESCKSCKQCSLFSARIFYHQFKHIITLLTSNRPLLTPFKSEQKLIQEMIDVLIENYHALEDDSCEQVVQSLAKYAQDQQKSDFLIGRCKKIIFEIVSSDGFMQVSYQKKALMNGIDLYRSLLGKKGELSQMEKLQLIDCVANLKRILSALIFQKRNQKQNAEIEYLQNAIDQSQAMQSTYLDRPARHYIEQLSQSLHKDTKINFQEFVSICLKSIYFLIFPNIDEPSEPVTSNLDQTNSVQQSPPTNQYHFLSGQMQEMASKLKNIKNKLIIFETLFKKYAENLNTQILSTCFERYRIQITNQSYLQTVLWQLNDLIYLAHLADLHSFKTLLISYRLSLLQRYSTKQVMLIELSKLALYELVEPQQQTRIKDVIEQQLRLISPNNPNLQYIALLKLLTNGETDPSLSQTRILKIIYLLKHSPLVYLNNIKSIVGYLFAYINSQGYNQGEVKSVGTLLKHSTILHKDMVLDVNLEIEALVNGWSCLQLLVLFSRKILKQSVELNELSKIKNFDKFSANLLIRSGNIAQTDLLFSILYFKRKEIDWLKVADSLRKVVAKQICMGQYKKIDRILCDKRKSLSIGINFEKITNLIDAAFRDCGRIGKVLGQIFMLIIKEMLHIDQWQYSKCRSKMQLYRPQLRQSFLDQIETLEQNNERSISEELFFDWQLAGKINTLLFQNYREAVALKDYLAQFVNMAIEQPQNLSNLQHSEIDLLIAFIALSFEEFNFHIKEFWLRNSEPFSLSESFKTLKTKKQLIIRQYTVLKNSYHRLTGQKQQQLSTCKYPLSLLFPLGRYLYNLAWKGGLLVSYVSLPEFEDKVQLIEKIIKSNHDIMQLKEKELNTQISAQKRMGLDKEMGKIVRSVDIGVVDQDLEFIPLPQTYAKILGEITGVHALLPKFLRMESTVMLKHLKIFTTRYGIKDCDEISKKILKLSKYMQQIKQPSNTLLQLHYKYLSFPFEGIEIFKDKGVFRVPSAQYLIKNQNTRTEHNVHQLKYLVNTRNDLPVTEAKFELIRKKFDSWIGMKGRDPSLTEAIHLFDKQIFLYMGHGTGMHQINPRDLGTLKIHCLMLVLGCSSAKMVFQESEPYGWALEMLMRGCPGYLGCLWNVTDVDIDKITMEMFGRERRESLAVVVSKERKKCTFANINGAALVVYGLPGELVYQ